MIRIKSIQSEKIREMAMHLYMQRIPITIFGKTWSGASNNWIYFDTVLDLEQLRKEFDLGDEFIVHENLDPKSGRERGFIDCKTGEGIMGKI